MKRLLLASLAVTFVASSGCAASTQGDQASAESKMVYAESAECREAAQPLVEAVVAIDVEADSGDMEAIKDVELGDLGLDPFTALGAPVLTEPFGLHCSHRLREQRASTDRTFEQADLMWGNDCFISKPTCDPQVIAKWLLAGIEVGRDFVEAVDRKVPEDELDDTAQPEGTVNLTGQLRLNHSRNFERQKDEGMVRCSGTGLYDDLRWGAPIVVTDADDRKVALGELSIGYVPTVIGSASNGNTCVFDINIEAVPEDAGVFSLNIAGFAGPDLTVAKYKSQPSTLVLSLG